MSGVRGDVPPDAAPVLLMHLLDRCNLRCRHCYVDAGPDRRTMLPLETARAALVDARRLGVGTVYLSGGEVMLYPHLSSVLQTAVGTEQAPVVVLATNGTLIDEETAELLAGLGAAAQVSIDGTPGYHDDFRRSRGAFERSGRGIERLVGAGVEVTVVTTVCRGNLDTVAWLAEWCSRHGVSRLSIQPLLALGRGAAIEEERLSVRELCDLVFLVSDLGRRFGRHRLRLSMSCRTKRYLLTHPCAAYVCRGAACHRGVRREIKKLVIREDGTVLPEVATLNRRYAVGNLHEAGLADLAVRYMADGYNDFHRMCAAAYESLVPDWPAPVVPWDEILSHFSWATGPTETPIGAIPLGSAAAHASG